MVLCPSFRGLLDRMMQYTYLPRASGAAVPARGGASFLTDAGDPFPRAGGCAGRAAFLGGLLGLSERLAMRVSPTATLSFEGLEDPPDLADDGVGQTRFDDNSVASNVGRALRDPGQRVAGQRDDRNVFGSGVDLD